MKLTETVYFINIDGTAPGSERLDGKRLAVLADHHDRDYEPVLDMLRNSAPDAIVIPGDIVLGYFPRDSELIIDRCRNIMPLLEGCYDIAPTYMSIGNHECLLCDSDFDMLRQTGAIVLNNEWTELRFCDDMSGEKAVAEPADRIYVGGFTSAHAISYKKFRDEYNRGKDIKGYERYPYRRRPKDIGSYPADSMWLDDFERVDGYKILLCHHPEYWGLREPMLRDRKIDLVLSGHAHGGQWRFFGQGVFAPGQGLLPKYTGGVYHGQYGSLVISRGLSNPYSAVPRLGHPCELVYVQFAAGGSDDRESL